MVSSPTTPRPGAHPLAVLFLCGVALSACDSTGPGDSPEGTYVLSTIDGAPLPFLLAQSGDDKVELSAGHITLNADASCIGGQTTLFTEGGAVTSEVLLDPCTWTRTEASIFFEWPEGFNNVGVWIENSLTLTSQGVPLVFRR
jgi:hypothetical protein